MTKINKNVSDNDTQADSFTDNPSLSNEDKQNITVELQEVCLDVLTEKIRQGQGKKAQR